MNKTKQASNKAWVVAVDMGYGHERPAFALKHLAHKGVVVANNYPGIPKADRSIWEGSRKFYEAASRTKSIPLVGDYLFHALIDHMQEIASFYPRRDLSRPSLQSRQLYQMIRRRNLGRHLIDQLAKKPLPLVSTFFLPAFMAEEYGYPGDIFCLCTDTDVSRAWAPYDPRRSRIKYLAPTGRVVERLKLYGVPSKNIFFTGFPLPKTLIDYPDLKHFHQDIGRRLVRLDPHGLFRRRYGRQVELTLGERWWEKRRSAGRPVITFAIGGAGAQGKLADAVLKSLRIHLKRGDLELRLVAATHRGLRDRFTKSARALRLGSSLNKTVFIDYWPNRAQYFSGFTTLLRRTDVLWTKPSEMSFYTGAGIPIIKAPAVGSQEEFNGHWLRVTGGGIKQLDPRHTSEWLFDLINSGAFARAAWSGYIEGPTRGTERIERVLGCQACELESPPLIV